jgi:hypothetical protein
MTLSIAELLFEDATLKNNQPLPETASEDFTVNQAFLNSLKKTVSGKIFSKLPDAKLVKKVIDEIKSVDSQEEKDKIQKQVEPIISDPLGAFSKQDLMRIAISTTNVSRLGPVVFDVAQMKTGKEQVKGFTGIDLELIKSTQIIPFLVMTKEGEVLSGENNRKGSFGYAFLAPAYYAKIEEKNVPVYEELFPGLLENHIINGEESKFAANVENLELPVVPIDSEILKFVQQAFKNQKTLPALVQKLQTTYRSTMQNIVRDEEEKGDSPAERQSQEELNAGLFENNSLVYKQGIKSLLAESSGNDYIAFKSHYEDLMSLQEVIEHLSKKGGDSSNKLYWSTVVEKIRNDKQLKSLFYKSTLDQMEMPSNDETIFAIIKNYSFEADRLDKDNKKNKTILRIQSIAESFEGEEFIKKNKEDIKKVFDSSTIKDLLSKWRFLYNKVKKVDFQSYDVKRFITRGSNPDKLDEVDNNFEAGFANLVVYCLAKKQTLKLESKTYNDFNKVLLKEDLQVVLNYVNNYAVPLTLLASTMAYFGTSGLTNNVAKSEQRLARICKHIETQKFWGIYNEQLAYEFAQVIKASHKASEAAIENLSGENLEDNEPSDESASQDDQVQPEEEQVVQPESKPPTKPPSPTDFKGRLENAARELERSLSLIVNRQEQSEEPNIVLARNLYASGSDKQKEALQKDDTNSSETIKKLLYGDNDAKPVDDALLKSFNSIITSDLQELKIKLEKDLEPDQLYTDIFNNKVPKSLEAAITAAATESAGSDEDQSTYIESLDEFKKRVNETCQRFNKVLKTVNIGSSSTQRNLVLKNKPILNFVARKIREEEKSYEDFFAKLLQGKDVDELATILKYFSFSPMFDFDGKLIDSLFENFQRHVKEREFKSLIFYVLRSNLNQEPTPIEEIMKEVLNDLFQGDEEKVQEIINGCQEYKDQCELFYGVEPSEEEAKDSQLEELCKSISRKLLEAEDEKAYNEKRREAQEKYEKEMLDAKKEQVRKEGFRFGVGAAIPLTVGVLGAIATGGLGAVALATAGILGMPVGALIGHSTVGLGPVQKDEVNKSDLTKKIDAEAKKHLKGLDSSIIEALKDAKIVEGIYVHERSLTELLFELKDFDVIGKKSRKKEIKKKEIKRKDFEDILTRNKVLMYDSKYASSPADISAVKNEFIESLNLLLSYYYNATIENVKQATSKAEVKAVTLQTAVSNRLEAAKDSLGDNAGQQLVEEFNQTTVQHDIPLTPEDIGNSFSNLDVENISFDFSNLNASFIDADEPESQAYKDKSGQEPQDGTEDDDGNILQPSKDKSKSSSSNSKLSSLKVEVSVLQDFYTDNTCVSRKEISSNIDFRKNLVKFLDGNKLDKNLLLPVVYKKENTAFIVGFVHENKFTCASISSGPFGAPVNFESFSKTQISDGTLNLFKFKQKIQTGSEENVDYYIYYPKSNKIKDYKKEVKNFLRKFLDEDSNSVKKALFKDLMDNEENLKLENKSNKSSSDYILGSLTNLLFESSNKEDLSVVKRVYNKKDSVNSSSLEKEWRRLWNIYK